MKKLLSIVLSLVVLTAFSQEPEKEKDANFYKKEGNIAYKAKEYGKAFDNYKLALELLEKDEIVDSVLYFNTGFASYKAKQYSDAIPYFDKCIELGIKGEKPYKNKAVCLSKNKDFKGMEDVLLVAVEKYPDVKKLKDLLAHSYLKQGLGFYKEGNGIKKTANESGWNESDPDKFKAEYAKADVKYNEALPFMEKAYANNAKNKSVLKALVNIYTNLDNQELVTKYQAELDAVEK